MSVSDSKMTIAILRPLADSKEPQFLEAARVSLAERTMLASFVEGGLVDGVYRLDEMGRPSDFANLTLTISGRTYLAEAEKKEADATSIGYLRNRMPKIVGWFFGILAALIVAWLIRNYV